ncbi:MAG TPA: HAD family phosphatase [Candidatus Anaerostipes avistercoris]|uniref:HAD family phosphatase n=1 Tax=Candidatus Anaerostipes avistercoris TaxID=2838462 RepID=A0A9D2PJG6_9FIRM|nr:HAD family phosphatase [uncultured Anaerostipes sp.]HJC50708.1 HAD family phosphatase [Candidatus Anaerostipes avistercoris]
MDKTRLKSLQAVVFDMDGLMFDSERYIQTAWNQAGTMLGYGTLGDHIEKTLGFNGTKRREFFLDLCGQDFPYDEFLELYRSLYFDRVRKEGIPAKEGLHETLEVLKKLGIRMGVATSSSRENTLKNLEREQISGYFQTVITGDMIQHGKPEPDIYLEACRKLGAEPQDAIALEDAINGIKAAARAGMMPVMIPDLIKDTTEVDDILFGRYDSLAEFAREIEECLGSSRAEKEK